MSFSITHAPIPRALQALKETVSIPEEYVERTSLDRDGSVWLETEVRGVRRWFRSGGEVREYSPLEDSRLPLCKLLAASDERLEILSWRPGRRIALCRRSETGAQFLKGVRAGRVDNIANGLELVHAVLDQEDDFLVPRLLQRSKETAAIWTHWLPFEPIGVTDRSESVFRLVGRALRRFQESVPSKGLAPHGFAEELQVLDRLADTTRFGLGSIPAGWQALREQLEHVTWTPSPYVAVHRDLHDGQLLTDGERVALIDFDLLTAGSAQLDIANLTVHLVLRELQGRTEGSRTAAEDCGNSLMLGFGTKSSIGNRSELRAYQAATFLRLALVYSLRPRWSHLPTVLIQYASRCLDELR